METEKTTKCVFDDLQKFNALSKAFEYRSFPLALRNFIDAYIPMLRPDLDAHCYEGVDFQSTEQIISDRRDSDEYKCVPVVELNRGTEMLSKVLGCVYQCATTVSISAYVPKDDILTHDNDIVYVLQVSVPTRPELDSKAVAIYKKVDFPRYFFDDVIPSILDRSINDPAFLLTSKAFDKHAPLSRYSVDHIVSQIVDEAMARGWYRVDRFGKQLLFIARLKLA